MKMWRKSNSDLSCFSPLWLSALSCMLFLPHVHVSYEHTRASEHFSGSWELHHPSHVKRTMSNEIKDKKIFSMLGMKSTKEGEEKKKDGKKVCDAVTENEDTSKQKKEKKTESGHSSPTTIKTSRMRREDTSHNDSYPIGESEEHSRI